MNELDVNFEDIRLNEYLRVLLELDTKGKKLYPSEFNLAFKNAIKLYKKGKWEAAKNIFQTLKRVNNDGSSEPIMSFMESHNFKAPRDWNGIRKIN